MKVPPTTERGGPRRFEPKTRDRLWKIRKKIDVNVFILEDVLDANLVCPNAQAAENLIKVELPEIALDPNHHRFVELYDENTDNWTRHKILKYSVDGRCLIQETNETLTDDDVIVHGPQRWIDFSRHRYRWIC